MTTRVRQSTSGFTLIETICIVLLMGLLAGAAMLSFARPLRAARANDVVQQLIAFDAGARQLAKRSGRDVEIIIDLFEQQLTRREASDDAATSARLALPAALRIEQVRSTDAKTSDERVVIRCSPMGISRSYAVRLVGPGIDRWLFVAGLSGQVTFVNDESQIKTMFQSIAPGSRRDAD